MKARTVLAVVGALAVMVVGGEALGAPSPAETLREWAEALKGGKVEDMLAFYEDSEEVVAIESSGKLRKGPAGIRAMYEEAFAEVLVERAELAKLKTHEERETAWATCRLIADSQVKADGARWRLEVYGSFVLRRSGGRWRIALEHFSKTADAPRVRRREEVGPEQGEGEPTVLREDVAGKTSQVLAGRPVTIALKGNPTTGYQWRLGKIEGESVRLLGKPRYVQEAGAEGRVGAGGTFFFRFTTVTPGKTILTLDYLRPWEKNVKPAKTLTFTILVPPKSD